MLAPRSHRWREWQKRAVLIHYRQGMGFVHTHRLCCVCSFNRYWQQRSKREWRAECIHLGRDRKWNIFNKRKRVGVRDLLLHRLVYSLLSHAKVLRCCPPDGAEMGSKCVVSPARWTSHKKALSCRAYRDLKTEEQEGAFVFNCGLPFWSLHRRTLGSMRKREEIVQIAIARNSK